MFEVTDRPGADGETEVATLIFECRLAVEAAVVGARRLRRLPPTPMLEAEIDRLSTLLEQTADALQDLHKAIDRDQDVASQTEPITACPSDLEEIGAAIMRAEIPAGGFIREDDLADSLGKELSIVREAAIWLEGRGVVERVYGIGLRPSDFSLADLRDIFEIREILEPIACAQAAEAMSDDEKYAVVSALERYSQPSQACRPRHLDEEEFPFQHDNFCCRIIRGSKNTALIELLCNTLHYRLWFYSSFFRQISGGEAAALAEQKRVAAALRAGDAALSVAEMRRYLANARARTTWVGKPDRYCNVEDLGAYRESRRPPPAPM
jgi:DNA-binding GntR family transcriptional regulator